MLALNNGRVMAVVMVAIFSLAGCSSKDNSRPTPRAQLDSQTSLAPLQYGSCKGPQNETTAQAKARLTPLLLDAGLRYAREHSHPVTGFVEDTVANYQTVEKRPSPVRASISSTGFLMALVANLYTKEMVSKEEAYNYCLRPLRAIVAKNQADAQRAAERIKNKTNDTYTDLSFKGWFSHFVDWETLDRWMGSEYALTDSTWMFSGMIVCATTFPNTEVATHADNLFAAVNFKTMMTDGGAQPDKLTLSLAYTAPWPAAPPLKPGQKPPEVGYSAFEWKIYQHSWLVYLLGLGAPNPDFQLPPKSWAAWNRTGSRLDLPSTDLNGQWLYGAERALFSHYFPDVYMPPQEVPEPCIGLNYFNNSATAVRFNRLASEADITSKTFKAGLWGLDAGPNPNHSKLTLVADDSLTVGTADNTTYGVNTPFKRNGTACPACAVAGAMFEPELVFSSLKAWCDDPNFGSKIWGKYGPTNGINLDYGWVAPYALSGIVGPMALSVANLDPKTAVWNSFKQYPAVQTAIKQAKLAPTPAECFAAE